MHVKLKHFFAAAAMSGLATVVTPQEPPRLTDAQMDGVTAGWSTTEINWLSQAYSAESTTSADSGWTTTYESGDPSTFCTKNNGWSC